MSSYGFIEAGRTGFPVHLICRMLGVSRSGYHGWRNGPPSKRSRENAALTEKVREIHRRSRETYGSPRVHAELRALGTRCGRKRVAMSVLSGEAHRWRNTRPWAQSPDPEFVPKGRK